MIHPYYQLIHVPIETRFCILFAVNLLVPSEYILPITTVFFLTQLYIVEDYLFR